ncbi:MAG: homoserine dehydrogenase [Acidobacteriia bacterium]|nr:homoserine dehydrogenase [Terriglobia bacterium]
MRVALIGYGNVGRAFAGLLEKKRKAFPFRIAGIHTARHGTAYDGADFGPAAGSVDEFLDRAACDVVVEITTPNPASGEPALTHIRKALARKRHVVTANKGPIAYAYAELRDEAERAGVQFRFESTVMDGTPVFNMVRKNLPGVKVLGFTGVLNSTSKVVIEAMREGKSMQDGIEAARRLGITEADSSYDIEGWDSAAKAAVLANVLMDARTTPLEVDRRGIGRLTPERVLELAQARKTVCLVSRGHIGPSGVRLRVRAEVVDEADPLASVQGTSNLLLLHTDLMGTIGVMGISSGVEQTAYGLFSDLVDIAESAK